MTTVSHAGASRGRRSTRPSGDDREQAILATAERLLEERAFSEISVDDLAKGAGLSRPTFYFYFPSKEAVLLTLMDRVMIEANARLAKMGDLASADYRASTRAGIDAFFATFAAHPALSAAAAEVRSGSAELRTMWSDFMRRSIEYTTGVIEAARDKGLAPVTLPAHHVSTALNLMNESVMTSSIVGYEPSLPQDHILDTLTYIWIAAIYGELP